MKLCYIYIEREREPDLLTDVFTTRGVRGCDCESFEARKKTRVWRLKIKYRPNLAHSEFMFLFDISVSGFVMFRRDRSLELVGDN